MSKTDQTAEDLFQSLTGYDEIAISKAFGEDLNGLRTKPFMFLRALIFVQLRRGGAKDEAAKREALEMTMTQLESFFEIDTEVMPEEPATDMGKGDSPSQ